MIKKISLLSTERRAMLLSAVLCTAWVLCQPSQATAQWSIADSLGNIHNTNGGNVGVGTAAPVEALTVANGNTNGLGIYRDLDVASVGSAGIYLSMGARSGSAFTPGAQLLGVLENPSATGYLQFQTRTAGSLTTKMSVLSNGNVGIGTASASAKLQVATNNDITPGAINTFDSRHFVVGLGGSSGGVFTSYNQTANSGTIGVIQPGVAWGNLILAPAGNVGIGTTSPQLALSINVPFSINGQVGVLVAGQTGTTTLSGIYDVAEDVNGGGAGLALYSKPSNGSSVERVRIDRNGNFGIGTTTPTHALEVVGSANVSGTITGANISAIYQDVAEWVPATKAISVGTVVVLDPKLSNHVLSSTTAYDTRVAGVISAQPGIALGQGGSGKVLVATTGRVKVKVDATKAPIEIGDLLVTSDKEGFAMKSEPMNIGGRKMHAPGTLIGKALEPLASGMGEILVLLSLQ